MTIETLEHIHKILLDCSNRRFAAYQDARAAYYAAKDAEKPNASELQETADLFWKLHSQAQDALLEFERQDWR